MVANFRLGLQLLKFPPHLFDSEENAIVHGVRPDPPGREATTAVVAPESEAGTSEKTWESATDLSINHPA